MTLSSGFGTFGNPTQPTINTGLNLGNTGSSGGLFANLQNPTANLFGSVPTANPTSGGLTLGSAGTLFSSTSIPATTTASGLNTFGTNIWNKPAFGTGITPATTTTATIFGLGTPATSVTTTATPSLGFNLSQVSAAGSGFGGFGTLGTTTSTTGSLGLGGLVSSNPAAAATTTTSVGLGGVDVTQNTTGLTDGGSTIGKNENKTMKEIPVPQEIVATVETFKKYVKDQKAIREEISRVSSKPLFKVQEETTALKNLLTIVSSGIQRNVTIVEKLKHETAQELKNAEIAQRTKDIPPGLQYENTAPTEYFQRLVVNFENRMQLYRQQIEQMEKHLLSLSQPAALSPQELTLVMKRLHETFIALAADLQTIHEAFKVQKEQYLNYRKIFLGDSTNLFQSKPENLLKVLNPTVPVTIGPTPFSGISNASAVALASALSRTQQPSVTGGFGSSTFSSPNLFSGSNNTSVIKPLGSFSSSVGFNTSGSQAGNSQMNFGFGSSSFTSAPATPLTPSKPFQLQKPPPGNKRGKRMAYNP